MFGKHSIKIIRGLLVACLGFAALLPFPVLPSSRALQARGQGVVRIKVEDGKVIDLYTESHALVIGVSNYTNGWRSLPGVRQDIAEVGTVLADQGFQVERLLNPTRAQLEQTIKQFIDRWGFVSGNRLLIYFAGHGYTLRAADGRNIGFIVPADAPDPQRDLQGFNRLALSMDEVEVNARRIQSKHALFVFDSCFSGSLFSISRTRVPAVIVSKTAEPVREFITAGTENQTVPDSSIFRAQFVRALNGDADLNGDGFVTGSELGNYLEDTVTNYSRGAQTPRWGKIRDPNLDRGDFVFALPKKAEAAATASGQGYPLPVATDPAALELEFWNSIKDSKDPKDFEAYLRRFPKGTFADLAGNRLAALRPGIGDIPPSGPPMVPTTATGPGGIPLVSFPFSVVKLNAFGREVDRRSKQAKEFVEDLGGDFKLEMVEIPSGTFLMGSTDREVQEAWADLKRYNPRGQLSQLSIEQPRHPVNVPSFYVGRFEVTQAQWRAVMGTNPSRFHGDDLPVEQVSWDDAVEFCRQLSRKTGRTYRLPSEAEWEYACRAGTTTPFNFGETISPAFVNYDGNRPYGSAPKGDFRGRTTPVGSLGAANDFGLYDIYGNVREWCRDVYHDNYAGAPVDGSAWESGESTSRRVLRGGSWYLFALICRSACRNWFETVSRSSEVGFRVVIVPRTQ